MGTFNIGPCECCGAESECVPCEIDLPDSVLVTVTGVVNSSPPVTASCCPEAQCCDGCDDLNASYVLDRVEEAPFGCCRWEGSFSQIRYCDPDGTDCAGVSSAALELCVVDLGGGNVGVGVAFYLITSPITDFTWGFSSDPAPVADCLAALGETLSPTGGGFCNFGASTAAVSL